MLDRNTIEEVLNRQSVKLVGEICKQNEIISKSLQLHPEDELGVKQAFELLKSFNREKIYEASRDLRNELLAKSRGKKFTKYKLYKPTNSNKREQ